MRKAFYFAMIFLTILSIAGCKSARIESVSLEQTPVIDGHDEEWKDAPFIYFDDANISAKTANDDENLYVFLRFTDQQIARRIQMFGITYYLNPRGKKGEDFRIKFRNDRMMAGRDGIPGEFGGRGMKDFYNEPALPLFGNMSAVEFLNEIPLEVYPLTNEEGPMCAFMVENGIKNYEFRIPLRMVNDDYEEINLAPEEIIGVGFEIGKPDISAMQDRMGGAGAPGGGRGGGMGGIGGGRGGGMGKGGMMGMRGMDLPEEIMIWTKITLAK